MQFQIVPASEVSLGEQAEVANAAFAGYVGGWADMNAAALTRFLMLQGTDLFLSRFVRTSNGPVGFAYLNRTRDILRLSGMAIVPSARGTGAAQHLLDHVIAE